MSTKKKNQSEEKVMDSRTKYRNLILKQMTARHPGINPMAIPLLKKIVINMGVGEAVKDKHAIENHFDELKMISGQVPVKTLSKKAISNFKLREDMEIGLMVTLRGKRMYDFLDRFCNINAPRIHDFRGFKRGQFDGRGNYNFGITDQTIFLEVNPDKVKRTQGMDIAVVTTARKMKTQTADEVGLELMTILGFPFDATSHLKGQKAPEKLDTAEEK